MKTKILKSVMALLVTAIVISSCDKEEEAFSGNSDTHRLSRILKYSDSNASILSEEVMYSYDEAGNMVKEAFYEYYATKILVMYREYEYAGNKKIKEKEKIFLGDSENLTLVSFIEYAYENGLLVREEGYREFGNTNSLIRSTHYEYDERGNMIRRKQYNNNSPGSYWGYASDMSYEYDDQNRLIVEKSYGKDKVKHFYDNAGREIKTESYEPGQGLISYVEIFYDGNNDAPAMELQYDKDGNQNRKLNHYYDRFGNLTESVINDECSMFKRKYSGKLLIEEILYWWHEYGHFGTGRMPENGMSRYEYEKK